MSETSKTAPLPWEIDLEVFETEKPLGHEKEEIPSWWHYVIGWKPPQGESTGENSDEWGGTGTEMWLHALRRALAKVPKGKAALVQGFDPKLAEKLGKPAGKVSIAKRPKREQDLWQAVRLLMGSREVTFLAPGEKSGPRGAEIPFLPDGECEGLQ